MIGSYNGGLVALSLAVAIGAAYVALELASRVAAARRPARGFWLAGGAAAVGLVLWSAHFLGLLSVRLEGPVFYYVPGLLLSLASAITASGVLLFAGNGRRLGPAGASVAALAMGAALAGLPAASVAAVRSLATPAWLQPAAALSVGGAAVTSLAALWFARHSRTEVRTLTWTKLAAAVALGSGLTAAHAAAVSAVVWRPFAEPIDVTNAVGVSALGVAGIAVLAIVVFGLSLLSAAVDRRLSAKNRELRSSEERYRLLFGRSLAGVYQSTLDGHIVDCNDALARMLGYATREALLERAAVELYHSPEAREPFLRRLLEQKALTNFENRLRRRDGTPVWVLENATLIEGTPGRAPIIEGTFIDITRRKEVEEEVASMTTNLIASVERYRVLVESTNAVPWEMDGLTHRFTYLSPQATRLFGYEVDELLNLASVWELVHPDDRARIRAQFADLVAAPKGDDLDTDYRVLTRTHGVLHVRSMVTLERNPHEEAITLRGITLDITRQRKLERELQQAQKLESVGRLAAGVAHEINTPVQFVSDSIHFVRDAMRDLTGLLARYRALPQPPDSAGAGARAALARAEEDADLEYLLENVPKALDRSLEGLDRVATIVRSMKEFAHPDQREMTSVDLNQAVRSTLVVARNEYKYVADVDLDLGDVPRVTCHGGDVNQAVLNIVVNAAHAIEDRVRGTDDRGRISVRTCQDGDAVVISISDTGHGIPDAIRDRIFDPFFTTKEIGRGTGQGLAIARSVAIDKHGGDLTFDTQTGAGTTFHLRLPIAGRRQAGVAA